MDLFKKNNQPCDDQARPLADRMRPKDLDGFVGQSSLISPDGFITRAIKGDKPFSMILWGPPGCGKTTLATIIAQETNAYFVSFSAVLSGVKEIRAVIDEAQKQQSLYRRRTILFVDEIHRFNKAQQDSFLAHVESGLITLIGATTENPSFEVIAPLLSRARVLALTPLTHDELVVILRRAVDDNKYGLGGLHIFLDEGVISYLARISDGDARKALNNLELISNAALTDQSGNRRICLGDAEEILKRKAFRYDKNGEEHYNLISAFHKSLRGSDPDAALYWMARMLEAGEYPLYIARRMIRFASEDIGIADPQALVVAQSAVEAFRLIGLPEGELALAEAAVYLATAPKSNSLYIAYGKVKKVISETGSLSVPFHIRNAPTKLMKTLGYGEGYQYAHDFSDAYAPQEYLPEEIRCMCFYEPA
ncbi:MAG: replication-associated recombination protein A [Pseudomonadota bacterium]